jgi:hypothetical protein
LGLPLTSRDGTGHPRLSFQVPQNPAATDGQGFADSVLRVEASNDLATWTSVATKTFASPWTGSVVVGAPAGGYIPVIVTDTATPSGNRRFLRLRVEWIP